MATDRTEDDGTGRHEDAAPGHQEGDATATLQDVVFSYERGVDLPDPETLARKPRPDPDDRGIPVLRGVDLSIQRGSFTVVMGASGGGKSTLLRTFNAIIPRFIRGSFDGSVEVLGRDTSEYRVPQMAELVGMVLQDYEAQLFGTSVTSELAFGPENLAVPVDQIDERIDHALELVGLADLDRRRPPDSLSGGQKQRLVFGGVIANQPAFMLLDEPTSDLDPAGSQGVLRVIRDLAVGTDPRTVDTGGPPGARPEVSGPDSSTSWPGPETILLVTHKIEEALLADRVVLLRGGRVFREGPARDVFTDVDALRASRVAVPPMVEVFDRLGLPREDLPLSVDEAVALVREGTYTWTPPARRGETLPGVPSGAGESPGDVVFEFSDLTYEYETDRETVRAVDGVDLTVREGEVLAIIGHNGSGKTTLAKHFNGLLEPDAGRATWRGDTIADLPMDRVGRSIGYVFQNPDHQIFAETVEEEVAFAPQNFGMTGDALDRAVRTALETVELDGLGDADPFNLSKGQRQRVALASILATDPEVIVFDEPTTGLDAAQQRQFMDLVAQLNRDAGVTVVMITHSMRTVARYAPRAVVMADGRKVADGPTRELFADEEALAAWSLDAPQTVALSNQLAEDEDALPALSVSEVVEGLGGPEVAPEDHVGVGEESWGGDG